MQSPEQLSTRLYGILALLLAGLLVPVYVAVVMWLWGVAVQNGRYLVEVVRG